MILPLFSLDHVSWDRGTVGPSPGDVFHATPFLRAASKTPNTVGVRVACPCGRRGQIQRERDTPKRHNFVNGEPNQPGKCSGGDRK